MNLFTNSLIEKQEWFAQQGIEVWSAREGEQRFDNHVDKLLNYIRFWQASGESEKTAIRVRTRHSQMVQDGQWRGGLVAYGYRLEFQGRTNKKGQPVRDLLIDEEEARVLLEMEKNNKKANEVQVDEILSWAGRFDDASYEAKHLVIAQLVDRIEIRKNDGYDITIHWRMTAEQFLGRKKEESA